MREVLRRYWPVAAAAALLLPHAALFDFVTDDAYISFRYARRLAEAGELTFNPGERVEGYSNFLWTVLLALAMKAGAGPVVASRFFGVVFAIGTLAVTTRLLLRVDGDRATIAGAAWRLGAAAGLAGTSAFACWTTGGLETMMFAFLITLGCDRTLAEIDREGAAVARPAGEGWRAAARRGTSGMWFGLAALTRPEGALLFGVATLFRAGAAAIREQRLAPRRRDVAAVAVFALIFVPYFAWRWSYYGHPFPNTFYVKSSGGAGTYAFGLYYLRRFAEDHGIFFLLPLAAVGAALARDPRARALLALAALTWAVFGAYVVKVGGDFMGLYRFLVPVLPLGAAAFVVALRALAHRLRPVVTWPVLALAGVTLATGYGLVAWRVSRHAATVVGADRGVDTPAYLREYALQRIPVGMWFGRHARPDDLMTVGGAGVIPYYAGIAAYDVFGLVDRTIAHDPAMTVSNRPGHQKWGSEAYMLSRRPTLITHVYCLHGPCPHEGWAPPGYEWVRVQIPGARPPYYSFLKRSDRAFGPFSASVVASPPPSGSAPP